MVKNKRKFYNIAISESDNNSKVLSYYQNLSYYRKCSSLRSIKSIVLNTYKNTKLYFTIYDIKPGSCLIDLECRPVNKSKC